MKTAASGDAQAGERYSFDDDKVDNESVSDSVNSKAEIVEGFLYPN